MRKPGIGNGQRANSPRMTIFVLLRADIVLLRSTQSLRSRGELSLDHSNSASLLRDISSSARVCTTCKIRLYTAPGYVPDRVQASLAYCSDMGSRGNTDAFGEQQHVADSAQHSPIATSLLLSAWGPFKFTVTDPLGRSYIIRGKSEINHVVRFHYEQTESPMRCLRRVASV